MVPLAGGRMGVAIGDVAGHGLPAVASMADARFSLRALALAESEPDRVLERVDQVVHTFAPDTMITALYGILDPARRTWSYANAGHIPPVVVGADGRATMLRDRSGPPLGLQQPYQRYDVDLDPGATLVLVTDGLIERRDESITVGLGRLASASAGVVADSERRCDQLLDALLEDENEDDAALVVLTIDQSGGVAGAPPQSVRGAIRWSGPRGRRRGGDTRSSGAVSPTDRGAVHRRGGGIGSRATGT